MPDGMLIVGDVHAQVGNLPECEKLIDFVIERAKELKPLLVVFLGDQYHNHAVVRVEVMEFWRKAFDKILAAGFSHHQVIALVGNHDQSNGTTAHAMLAHADQITVVDRWMTFGNTLFLSYMDGDEFVKACNGKDFKDFPYADLCNTVICHQTFQGAQYDNGFYAKDGIDLNLIPQKVVISGHIHTQQRVGRCWYPGSPRWMGIGDANVDKAIWYVEIDDSGTVTTQPQDTYAICRPIRALVETPDSLCTEQLESHVSYVVDLRGSPAWIEERLKFWKDKARVRTFPVEAATATVRESDGIAVAFDKYVDAFDPKFGTDRPTLKQLAKERIFNE